MKKLFALILAGLITFSFASCGSSDKKSTSTGDDTKAETKDTLNGEVREWGNIKMLSPDGYTFTEGSYTGSTDPNCANITDNTNPFNYFIVTIMSEEEADNNISMTKEINESMYEVKDVAEFELNGGKWSGITYHATDYICSTLKCEKDGLFAIVQMCGFEVDSDMAKSVLGSIELSDKVAPDTSEETFDDLFGSSESESTDTEAIPDVVSDPLMSSAE